MPSNAELQTRIKELEEELEKMQNRAALRASSQFSTLETTSGDFAREVWKAVLVGATSALFDPSRIPMTGNPKALDHCLKRALHVADRAAEIAKNHRDFQDKEEAAKILNSPDPLQSLMGQDDISE